MYVVRPSWSSSLLQQSTSVVMGPRFRGDDDRWEPALLLRRRRALDERLAALHLVGQRRLVDLDHDRIGIDAEVLDQRLGDVAHHAGLLFVGAAGSHAYGDLRHFWSPRCRFFSSWPSLSWPDLLHQTRRGCPAQGRA